MPYMWTRYNKTIAAVITGVIGWATLVVNSEVTDITSSEWIVLATAVATAIGVFTFPNTEPPVVPPPHPEQ